MDIYGYIFIYMDIYGYMEEDDAPLWVGGYMGKELAHSGSYHGDQDAVAWTKPPLKCNAQQQLEGKLVDYCPTNLLKSNLLKSKCTST